jgi:sirohydrochlorin ferrochelatase
LAGQTSYEKARHYIETSARETQEAKLLKKKLHPGPCITLSRETGIGAEVAQIIGRMVMTKIIVPLMIN